MAKKEKAPDDGTQPAKKGKLKLIIIVVLGLLLTVGASVGGTWFVMNKKVQQAETAKTESAAPVRLPAIYEKLTPSFVVNFNMNGRQRYMQIGVALMGRDQVKMDALKAHLPQVRNQLVMLFSGQNFDTLLTPVGKELLRQQATSSIQELAQKQVGQPTVEQVLFTNFVLQ
ncbi:flagellar FliL protein [Pseudomonas duriflava]|uniref:Flagellar protein FliL n=1 Tax=Pseudomonas duriflava TaxID=459528 RepID=A0A562QD12_9PSED|nr:flagellar basal body-associated protein FliL [Pseudomonas duriflava]TWI53916.1 flagellar FliL protein [Pseudomonas duriflava]